MNHVGVEVVERLAPTRAACITSGNGSPSRSLGGCGPQGDEPVRPGQVLARPDQRDLVAARREIVDEVGDDRLHAAVGGRRYLEPGWCDHRDA